MKFRTKVVVYMVSMLAIIFGAGSSVLIYNSYSSALNREKISAKQSYDMMLSTLKVVNKAKTWTDSEDLSTVIKEMTRQKNASWVAIRVSKKNRILYKSGEKKDYLVNMQKSVNEKTCKIIVLSPDETSRYLQISGALQVGEEVAYLDILYDVSSIYKEREELVHIYYEIFALLVVICGIVSYSNSFLMTRPLTKLARTSKLIAAGSLSSRSKVKTNDEIGQLSKEFDCMADQLEKNINDLKETMESQNQFIGNFTHELKTPMTSIIGYADLIRTQSLDEQEQIEAINYIYSEGKRLERLSLKLLDIFVTDNAEINLTVASPKKIVESVISNLQNNYLKKGISLSCKCEEGTCMLEPDLVRSLVINLIDNGRKAMTNGGHIYVQTTMTDKGCIIQVKDDGRGMPKDAIAHITEAFYRVDKSRSRQHGGAGLGLALCENIIKLHNGNINFKSKENVGTIVNVELKGGRE